MFFVVMAIGAVNTSAQNALVQNSNIDLQPASSTSAAVNTSAPVTPATQAVINSLSTLPEADMLVYLNPQRILNELLPKVLPAKDVEGMRKGFDEVRKNAGVDPTKVDYIVMAVRFKKPTGDLNFQAPEL